MKNLEKFEKSEVSFLGISIPKWAKPIVPSGFVSVVREKKSMRKNSKNL